MQQRAQVDRGVQVVDQQRADGGTALHEANRRARFAASCFTASRNGPATIGAAPRPSPTLGEQLAQAIQGREHFGRGAHAPRNPGRSVGPALRRPAGYS